jgi:hypothetical protein
VNGDVVLPGAGAGIGAGGEVGEVADGTPADGVGGVGPDPGAVAGPGIGASDGEEITSGDASGPGIPGATPIVGITPYAPGGAGGA